MNEEQQRFIYELEKELEHQAEQQNIVAEYKAHIYDLVENGEIKEENAYDELVKRLGSPREIAKVWKQETGSTPRKTQWLFVILNVVIFIGGTILTISYNVFEWHWLEHIWNGLMEIPFIIMTVYLLFWGLLGYEIGKEFGHRGLRLLKRTFLISIIPNLLLMYVIIFKIFPHEWFGSLLTYPFIIICIVFTLLLYPVSLIGYYWGRKVSI